MNIKQVVEFGEWLKDRSMNESWITVAQHDVFERDGHKVDLFMTSVLAPTKSSQDLLANSQWLASNDFGNVDVGADGAWVKVQTEEYVGKNGDVRIEPFTFLRLWYHNPWPNRIDLIQNFILFYNLHYDASHSKYAAVNMAGETTDVIKVKDEKIHQSIKIRVQYLRNYLACRKRVLIRQHDNRIHFDKPLAEFGVESFRGRRLNDSGYVFDLTAVDGGLNGKGPAISVLNGKDLILPFDKCQDLLSWPKGNSEFIIDIDDHGNKVMAAHTEDDGPNEFLTPVYFKRDVLKKYYDSTKYNVDHGHVSYGAHWDIPIDTNKADLVQVYLGDLGRLPANDQLHWQSYNVSPEGGISERRYARDFNASFVDSDDVVYQLRESVHNFQKMFERRFGFRPFLQLREEDAHKENNIRIPLNNGPDEFERQLNYLAVWLPGSIDEKGMRKHGGLKYDGVKKGHSISVFDEFLKNESLPRDIIPLLQQIQNLRSSTDAHRKGRKYERDIAKYGLDKIDERAFICNLLTDLTKAFNDLTM